MDLPAWDEQRLAAYKTEKANYTQHMSRTGADGSGSKEDNRITPMFSLMNKHNTEHDHATQLSAQRGIVGLPQYGLLGFNVGSTEHIDEEEPILQNVSAPASTFICGSQGSGKSYTLAVMVENCLLRDKSVGKLQEPIAGLVFHYDADSSGTTAEAARLCSRGIKVRVLVSESNLAVLEAKYTGLDGAKENLTVNALKLKSEHLTVDRMLNLMAVSDQTGPAPLYLHTFRLILRDMATQSGGKSFDYQALKSRLQLQAFTDKQTGPLQLRLDLLESFMEKQSTQGEHGNKNIFALEPGTLTIIDLSDPFVDTATACTLFDVCFNIAKGIIESQRKSMVVTLDEAHKFMNQSTEAETLASRLLTTVREQRHKGIRVIIATQEPTISPKLLDLCDVTIVHFFKSPKWFDAIKKHLGGASSLINTEQQQKEVFKRITQLKPGESLVFTPSSFLCFEDGKAARLGTKVMKMKTRMRRGQDGGKSLLAEAGSSYDEEWSKGSSETSSDANGLSKGMFGVQL